MDGSNKMILVFRTIFKHPENRLHYLESPFAKLTEDWSLAHFVTLLEALCSGAGLIRTTDYGWWYRAVIKSTLFWSDDQTPMIPQDERCSKQCWNWCQLQKLQEWLGQLDPVKLGADEPVWSSELQEGWLGPLRLLCGKQGRLQKVLLWSEVMRMISSGARLRTRWSYFIVPLAKIQSSILQRVVERFDGGAPKKSRGLLALKLPSSTPVLTTLGCTGNHQYLEGKISATECHTTVALHEFQYAKRQLTWWNKN